MASILDVARYLLRKDRYMNPWALHKLCYYAQAWHMVWTGENLFEEDFEAWEAGPVNRDIYLIQKVKYAVLLEHLNDPSNLTDDQKESLDVVWRDYGSMIPPTLRSQVLSEDPWLDAIEQGANATITKESMLAYYGGLYASKRS